MMAQQAVKRKGIDWSLADESRESFLEHVWSSAKVDHKWVLALTLGLLALLIPMFVLYRSYFGNVDYRIETSLIVTFVVLYCLIRYPLGRKKWSAPLNGWFAIDLLLILFVLGIEAYLTWGVYVHDTKDLLFFDTGARVDHIVGAIMIAITLEATRRGFGWVMVALPMVFIIYSLFAQVFPGGLRGAPVTWTYLMEILWVLQDGVYGTGANILLTMLFIYLLFGSLLVSTKVGAPFQALAIALTGKYDGGPAKAAVIGSSLIGMTSGSAIGNVVTVGSITIPLMKRAGYSPTFAAAVEAVASSGGQFMPPIMGASAFLIAAFTGLSYFTVAIYAATPAVLYYLSIFLQIHFRAKRQGLKGLPAEEVPSFGRVLLEGGHLLLPLVFIVAGMAMGYSVTMVGVWGIASIIVLSFIKSETRQNPRKLLLAFERATDTSMFVCICIVTVGIIVGSIMITGLGVRLTFLVESLMAGNLLLGLILAAVVCIILGLPLNPLLCYLLTYAFVIPALVNAASGMGTPPIAFHLFAFLFAAAAVITPPVCEAAFAAAAIARAPPMATGWQSMRLGMAAYIVPFIFVYEPALLILGGDYGWMRIAQALVTTVLGLVAVSAALEGWFVGRASLPQRVLMGVAGLILFVPGVRLFGDAGFGLLVVGLGTFALVTVWQIIERRPVLVRGSK